MSPQVPEFIMITTKMGKAIKFPVVAVRIMGRTAKGVTGIKLASKDEVVDMITSYDHDSIFILSVSKYGRAKRTKVTDFPLRNRGGIGVLSFNVSKKTGPVVATKAVVEDSEIMIISARGKTIRLAVKNIRETGRVAQGVSLIKLADDDWITGVTVIPREPHD